MKKSNLVLRRIVALGLSLCLMATGLTGCQKEDTPSTEAPSVTGTTQAPTDAPTKVSTEAPTEAPTTGLEGEEIVAVPDFGAVTLPESEALDFVEKLQLGWNLGNTFDASDCNVTDELDYEKAWCGQMTTETLIQYVKAIGFETIRIPVSWHNHLDENGKISEVWLNRIQEVVDWSLDAGLYVILNVHHDNGTDYMFPDYAHVDQSKAYLTNIWTQLSARFADYDERLIFETMNEPRLIGTNSEWWINVNSAQGKEALDCINQMNQAAVDAIRGNGSEYNLSRYIMVPGYCASPDFALANAFQIPTDASTKENRILISVHAYTPYSFALQAEHEGGTTEFSIENKKGTGDIDNFMKRLYDKFTSKGIGVVIGEFGARAKTNNLQARNEFAAYYVALTRHYGMTCCWWDNNAFTGNGENFGLIRRAKEVLLFTSIMAQMEHYSQSEK